MTNPTFHEFYWLNLIGYWMLMVGLVSSMHYFYSSNFYGFLFSTLLANCLLGVNLIWNKKCHYVWWCGSWILFIIMSIAIMSIFTSLDSLNDMDELTHSDGFLLTTPMNLLLLVFPIFVVLFHWQMKRVARVLNIDAGKVLLFGSIINTLMMGFVSSSLFFIMVLP